jgi:hypothetical protein
MTKTMITLAAGIALLGASPIAAQDAPGAQDAPRAERMERAQKARTERGGGATERAGRPGADLLLDRSIGRLMDRRYEVGLTDDQMSRLGNLRREATSALAPIRRELTDVREGQRDGTLTRAQADERMKVVREGAGSQEELRNRFEEILEPEQRQILRQDTARRRARRR